MSCARKGGASGLVLASCMLLAATSCGPASFSTDAEMKAFPRYEPDGDRQRGAWIEWIGNDGARLVLLAEGASLVEIGASGHSGFGGAGGSDSLVFPVSGEDVARLADILQAAWRYDPRVPRIARRKRTGTLVTLRWSDGVDSQTTHWNQVREPTEGLWAGVMEQLRFAARVEVAKGIVLRKRAEQLAEEGEPEAACRHYEEALSCVFSWGALQVARERQYVVYEPENSLAEARNACRKGAFSEALKLYERVWGELISLRDADGLCVVHFRGGFLGLRQGPEAPSTDTLRRLRKWEFAGQAFGGM